MGISTQGMVEFWEKLIDTHNVGAMKVVGEEPAKQYEVDGITMGSNQEVEYALDIKKE